MKKIYLVFTSLLLSLSLVGCAQNLSPNSYYGHEVNASSTVKKGVIVSRRAVNVNNNTGVGGLAGAATGAAAGSMIGGNPAVNIIGAIGGAVVGGLAGNAIDSGVNRHQGIEYIIKLNDGNMVSVVQVQQGIFNVHQRVMVLFGHTTRIIPDNSVS